MVQVVNGEAVVLEAIDFGGRLSEANEIGVKRMQR
jgi:hypothetical protein